MVTGAYMPQSIRGRVPNPRIWPVTSEMIDAVSLLKEHPLRTGDAIQLASLFDVRNNLADPDISFCGLAIADVAHGGSQTPES